MDVPVVGDARSAERGGQGRVHPDREEESTGHVSELGFRQGCLPLRRAAEEVSSGSVRASHATPLT